ncbi:MAG: RNA methyltransferase [Candidatus Kapabacteria bacterium]|nr:RNA methyltransferase [Candidatus Kapabacteria bacterium]
MTYPTLPISVHQYIRLLRKRSERDATRQCVLEGEHLCDEYRLMCERGALALPFEVVIQNGSSARVEKLAGAFDRLNVPVYATSEHKFQQLCDAQTPQGIIAVVDFPELPLETDKPLLILDAVADPGNVGTIIRTAEWFGVRNILLGAGSADRFHPKTLRATMGSVFRCAVHSTPNLAKTLQEQYAHYRLYGTAAGAALKLEEIQLPRTWGVVLGSEAHGISPEVEALLHGTFRIDRASASEAESLNVAVAAGVILHHCSTL